MTRTRDRLGRPVPADSPDAFATVPERASISAEDAWGEAIAYLDQGLPFHAHEVCEQRWRCAPDEERLAWQGLAQWGAALTHQARGNDTGAERVAQRALATLSSAQHAPNVIPAPIDVDRVRASLAPLAAQRSS